jgi:hypothetical protein
MKADGKALDKIEADMKAQDYGNTSGFIRLGCCLLLWIARWLCENRDALRG